MSHEVKNLHHDVDAPERLLNEGKTRLGLWLQVSWLLDFVEIPIEEMGENPLAGGDFSCHLLKRHTEAMRFKH